jgi:hypothetical protein
MEKERGGFSPQRRRDRAKTRREILCEPLRNLSVSAVKKKKSDE